MLFAIMPSWADPACGVGQSPDFVTGDIWQTARYSPFANISAFSLGTAACNLGTCRANWIGSTPDHPVIAQNMFRLKNGRFEQIGQSWLKHGFGAAQESLCSSSCVPSDYSHLGVNCADPYTAFQNGSSSGLGPKSDVNASTGAFPYPPTGQGMTGNSIFRRLQVHNSDLDPALNPNAVYFVEAQYVAADDARAGHGIDNASYRRIDVIVMSPGNFNIALADSTQRQRAAIEAWRAYDSHVDQRSVVVPDDGRYIVAVRVTDIGGNRWHYEYAVHNLNSHRSARSFSVPIPPGANVSNVGFHDVDYHSGEPYSGTDWSASVGANAVVWATSTYAQNPNANALRWGTLYNFRFDADVPPVQHDVTIGLFRPGTPTEVTVTVAPPRCFTTEVACGDSVDDDCDGLIDCADSDCCSESACASIDNDGDGRAPCAGDCDDGNSAVYAGAPQICDGINNDCSHPSWPGLAGTNEVSDDGDPFSECTGDCNDNDGSAWATPGEVRSLLLVHDRDAGRTVLGWAPPLDAGGSSLSYDVIRSDNPADFTTGATCLVLPNPSYPSVDTENPSPGNAFHYLVRAENGCPAQGPLGTSSSGVPRTGRSCP